MKGNGAFSSRGSSGGRGEFGRGDGGSSSGEADEEALFVSALSRRGLNMLAGRGCHGEILSLKPRPARAGVVPGLCDLAGPSGGGVAGNSIRGGVNLNAPGSLGFRVGDAGAGFSSHGVAAGKATHLTSGDVGRLSTEDCWKLIIERGKRWPVWNAPTSLPAPPGVKKEHDLTAAVADRGHHFHTDDRAQQRGQDFLKVLASRALEALAQEPLEQCCGRVAGGMQPPKQTSEAIMDMKLGRGSSETSLIPTLPTLYVYKPPTSSAEAPTSAWKMPFPGVNLKRPRTAALTIFYDGIVNVSDNVPAEKAHVIMKFAEKAGVSAQEEALLQKAPLAAPPSRASPQAFHASDAGRSPRDFRDSKCTSSQVALPARPSPVPSHPARSVSRAELSLSEQQPANEKLNRGKAALVHEKPPMPVKITVTPEPGNPRPVRQNVILKPLPSSRKNSLARFLDSRKRNGAPEASSEDQSPKRPAIEGSGPSGAENSKPGSGNDPAADSHAVAGKAATDAEMRWKS